MASINHRKDSHPVYQALRGTITNETDSEQRRPSLEYREPNKSDVIDFCLIWGSCTTPSYNSAGDITTSPDYHSNVQPSKLRCIHTEEQEVNEYRWLGNYTTAGDNKHAPPPLPQPHPVTKLQRKQEENANANNVKSSAMVYLSPIARAMAKRVCQFGWMNPTLSPATLIIIRAIIETLVKSTIFLRAQFLLFQIENLKSGYLSKF